MDSDEEFYGGRKNIQQPATLADNQKWLETAADNNNSNDDGTTSNTGSETETESDADNGGSERSSNEDERSEKTLSGEGSSTGSTPSVAEEGGAEQEPIVEDPLSDVWSSDDEKEDDDLTNNGDDESSRTDLPPEPLTLPSRDDHECVVVKGRGGVRLTVDVTPPERLLEEADIFRRHHYQQRNADECIQESVRCLCLTRIIFGDALWWKIAECEVNIARAYWELLEYPQQTQQHCEEARRLTMHGRIEAGRTYKTQSSGYVVELPTKEHLLEISLSLYYLLGKSLLALRHYAEADQHFVKAEQILTERNQMNQFKRINFWTVELCTARARVQICQQNHPVALEFLMKVRKLLAKKYGKGSTKLIPLLQEMARMANGNSAVKYALSAYNIAKAQPGSDEAIATAAQFLAGCYAKSDADEAEIYAESYFNEAVCCFKLALGDTHPKTLKCQLLLATHLADKNRTSDALILLNLMRVSYESAFGQFSAQNVQFLKRLAELNLKSEHLDAAVRLLKQVVQIERHIYGAASAKTDGSRRALSVLLQNPNLKAHMQTPNRPPFQTVVARIHNNSGQLMATGVQLGVYKRL